jgi:tetratricopeptide (TPR) repeat protein
VVMRVERTLAPGKLVREASGELRRVLVSEMRSGEVVVSLLETASDEPLRSGATRLWVALTDRRALVLAADSHGDSVVESAEASTVVHRGKLGRDEIVVGARTLKCPLLRGGTEFKQFAKLAEASPIERLQIAARTRLGEGHAAAAAALADAGLEVGSDTSLLTLRVLGLVESDHDGELGAAIAALVKGDPDLIHWDELFEGLRSHSRALSMLYQASREAGSASRLRARLDQLRAATPGDTTMAELAIAMDVDAGDLAEGLERAVAWRREGAITPQTFLALSATLNRAGLSTEPLHRRRAATLAKLGNLGEALEEARKAVSLDRTHRALRVLSDVLILSGRASEAVEPLEQLLAEGEDEYWIRSKLAEAYEAAGRLAEALTTRERALISLLASESHGGQAEPERRALARLHRAIAPSLDAETREVRLACADLLDRGLDWAARLIEPPGRLFAGDRLETTVEILAARRLGDEPVTATLSFEEEITDAKPEPSPAPPLPPRILADGVTGVWPATSDDGEVVLDGKRNARARYGVGPKVALELPGGLELGLHRAKISLEVPADVRPAYESDRAHGRLDLEVSPPRARFPLRVALRHANNPPPSYPLEREGTGKHGLKILVPDPSWALGGNATVTVKAQLDPSRLPTRLEVALLATERLRPPHKGERIVETHAWGFPIFGYELEERTMDRTLVLELPRDDATTATWTWFELVWSVSVRLVRKDKIEASAEVPIWLKYPAS